jgi:Flp pilus assembly pilin Flp
MSQLRRFFTDHDGLATVEYIVGAAVILGTLVVGVSAWNNGLVSRLQSLVSQMQAIR